MQKALLMPKLDIKDYYFARKLVLFNETFAQPWKNGTAWTLLWHEGIGGSTATDITSAYVTFISNFGWNKKQIVFFADNCSSQNKCWVLYSTLVKLVNSSEFSQIESITMKYFETGHSYMAADSVHGTIARAIEKKNVLGDFKEYKSVIDKCRRNLVSYVMSENDFCCHKREKKLTVAANLRMENIKQAQFRRGSASIFFKTAHCNDSWQEESFLSEKVENKLKAAIREGTLTSLISHIKTYPEGRGIPACKKTELMKLAVHLPISSQAFFNNLKIDEKSKDLHATL